MPEFRIRGLGLKKILLEYSVVNALRLSRLSALAYQLEERISDPVFLNSLSPGQLGYIYKLITDSMKDASSFIQETVTKTDWQNLESDILLEITQSDTEKNPLAQKDLELLAKDVLLRLAQTTPRNNDNE